MTASRGAGDALAEHVRGLDQALARGGGRVPEDVADQVRTAVDGVRERLALGVEHTVVALVGGTGSGKSSLFNALAGLPFAEVGVRRPTTADVTACAWSHDAGPFLDRLGVAHARRTDRESALDGDSQADLRGLVLLDLPDHDSVEPRNRTVVDRVLPQVDLLVWVVDPQKYADDALHTGYLRHLAGHEGAMVMVLNHLDTVPLDAQAGLLRDVARLIAHDGLADVAVLGVSARTGEGVPLLRGMLARAVAGRAVAEVRAAADLGGAARLLEATVAEGGPGAAPSPTAVEDGLAQAAGLASVIRTVEEALGAGWAPPVSGPGPLQPDRVAAVRSAWVADAGGHLPERWRAALDDSVASAEVLTATLDAALGAVVLGSRPPAGPRAARVVAGVVGVVALLGLGLLTGVLLGGGGPQVTILAVASCAALGVAAALVWWSGRLRRAEARRRAADLGVRARAAIHEVAAELLVGPTTSVLDDHDAVRSTAQAVAASTGAAAAVPSPA